jgi:hypothetical protein
MHATASTLTKRRTTNVRALIVAAFVLLAVFAYTQGTFDNFLWKVGLNYNECATNGFGATFCGDSLKEYKVRIGQQ